MKKLIYALFAISFLFCNYLFAQSASCSSADTIIEDSTCNLQSYTLPGNSSAMTDPSCATTTTHDDGWFQFVAAYNTTTITINTAYLPNLNPPYNYPVAPVLAVYSSCSSSAEIACADSNHAPISVTFATTVGNTYYFRFLRETQFYPSSITAFHMYGQFCIYGANTSSNVTAAFSASDSSLCDSDCVTFTDSSTGSPTNWIWSFPGGTPDSAFTQNPGTICYDSSGTYDATLIVYNSTDTDTTTINNMIVVNNCVPLNAAFSASDTTLCDSGCVTFTDLSTGNPTSWYWEFPGGTPGTSTSQNPTVCYDSTGSYDVTLFVSDSLMMITDSITLNNHIVVTKCATGIKKFNNHGMLNTYYNSDNKNVVININNIPEGNYHLSIVNSLGQRVINENLSVHQSSFRKSYNLQKFSNGIYFIRLSGTKQQYNVKFIKY